MKISGIEDVKKYIPQREPMIMVDCIEEVTDDYGIAGLTITKENLFVENNMFCESGITEHIAQSAAANMGYGFLQENKPVPIGYIASIKNLNIKKLPCVGDSIRTKIMVTNQILDITIVQSQTFLDNEEIANCEMRIFVNEN